MDKYNGYTIMLSGGGTRFAMYGGMFQALDELALLPRFIVASCGGAIAATVINAFKSHDQRKAYFCSREFYHFVCSLKTTQEAKLHKLPIYCIGKLFNRQYVPIIEDVFNRYLVGMPDALHAHLPSLDKGWQSTIPTIIVGCKLLFADTDINHPRNGRQLYKRVLFTDPDTAHKIIAPTDYPCYKDSAIDSGYQIITDADMLTAARVSLSDMFYVTPVRWQENWYMGGAVDLVPTELAALLGCGVIGEYKQRYTGIEEALVRAVFGFSANRRLNESEQTNVTYYIDMSDNEQQLRHYYIGKKIDWLHWRLAITNAIDYPEFCLQIEKQWRYGYDKTLDTLCQ